jgi:oxygen-dependent protoporphyrinogen oxidase
MESLAGTLRLKCPNVKWILSTPIELIHRTAKTWTILDHEYDFVVVAAFKTPKFSTSSGERIRFLLDSVHHNSAVVVAVCFDHLNREGFGWLVPQSERHSVLACTYLNNKFAGRLPENKFLVRLFIGGEAAAHWIRQSDESICEEALREMKRIAGIDQTPRFWRVYRWPGAMPEYNLGHTELLENVRGLAKLEGNLFFTGNVFAGVGIPDCIAHAEKIAEEIVAADGL